MSWLTTLLRRTMWLVVLGALGGAAFSWLRARRQPPESAAPEWPPLATRAPTDNRAGPTTTPAGAAASEPDAAPDSTGDAVAAWVAPGDDGSCPPTHPVKANDNSGIFHVPGGQFYDRTRPERCYTTAEAAIADGYRQAKA